MDAWLFVLHWILTVGIETFSKSGVWMVKIKSRRHVLVNFGCHLWVKSVKHTELSSGMLTGDNMFLLYVAQVIITHIERKMNRWEVCVSRKVRGIGKKKFRTIIFCYCCKPVWSCD